MAPNLGLLQALGDPFNEPIEAPPPEEFEFRADPRMVALLQSPRTDPSTKRQIREQLREQRRMEKIQFQIRQVENRREFEKRKSERSVFSKIGGVPVGFQLGTYSGIQNPFGRFLVDVVADPLNLVGGIGIGSKFGVTSLGRAAKFLKGASVGDRTRMILEGAEFMAKAGVHDDLAQGLRQAMRLEGAERGREVLKLFKRSRKLKIGEDDIGKLRALGADDEFLDMITNPKKSLAGVRDALSLADDAEIGRFKTNYLDRLASGQQSLIRFDVPFSSVELGGTSLGLPKLVAAMSGDVKTIQEASEGLASAGKLTAKGLSDIAGFGDEFVKSVNRENFDLQNSTAMVEQLGRSASIVADIADPDTYIGKVINGDIMEEGVVGKVLSGETSFSWLTEMGLARYTRQGLNAMNSMANVMEVSMKSLFSDDELVAITKLREGLLGADEAEAFVGGLSHAKRQGLEIIDNFYNRMGEIGVKTEVFEDTIANYVPHIYEVKNKDHLDLLGQLHKAVEEGSELPDEFKPYARKRDPSMPKSRFGLERRLESYEIAEQWIKDHPELGIRIKTRNIAELTGLYIRGAGSSMVKNQMLKANRVLPATTDGLPQAILKTGKDVPATPEVLRGEEILRDNPGRYEKLKGPGIPKSLQNMWFHRDVIGDAKTFYEQDFINAMIDQGGAMGKAAWAADRMNSMGKAALFNLLPFFHGMSLIYSNMALMPPAVALKQAAAIGKSVGSITGNAAQQVFQSIAYGKIDPKLKEKAIGEIMDVWSRSISGAIDGHGTVISGRDVIEQYLEAGVRMGRVSDDSGFGTFANAMQAIIDSGLPEPARRIGMGAGTYNDLADKGLWSIMHEGLMLSSWVHIRNKAIREGGDKFKDIIKLKELNSEVGRIVGQAYGGILEQLVLHPSTRKAMRFALLAPDWTLSNLLMARDLVFNAPGIRNTALAKKLTPDVLMRDLRFKVALGYNLRAALYAFIGANVMNFLFTKIKNGKGRFAFEDEGNLDPITGLHTRVELPYNRDDGRAQYMDLTKQFAEPLKMILDPKKFVTGKMGSFPRIFQAGVVGVDAFGRPIAGAHDGPFQEVIHQIAASTGQFAPIPVQSALDAARGKKHPLSSAISTLSGLSIRTEDPERHRRNLRIKELKAQLEAERYR